MMKILGILKFEFVLSVITAVAMTHTNSESQLPKSYLRALQAGLWDPVPRCLHCSVNYLLVQGRQSLGVKLNS